jgi:predicted PurR-regulated permease PerM
MMTVAGLYLARDVLIPVALAVLLSFVLAPVASLLRPFLGKVPSVFVAVFVAFALVLALGGVIGTQLADLAGQAPRYQYTIEHKIEAVRSFTAERLAALLGRFGVRLGTPASGEPAQPPAPAAAGPAVEAERKPLPVEVHQPNPSPLELAERILAPILGPISTLAIVFVIAIFVLLQREDLRDRLIRLIGSRDLHRTTIAMDEAAERLSRYFLTQLAINAGFGVVISAGLWLIGVPSPALWGAIGALLRFVPYLGAFLSAVLPLAVAAAVDPGWTMVVWTLALYLVVEPLTGQTIEPLVYGRNTGLSPISVVIAATFWAWLWGPIGLLVSTPLTLCLVVLGRHVDRFAFLDVMLGDTPPLTLVETFYQRLLADDPDEVEEQAEQFLKERPLSAYYDEVAVEGLRLAAVDARRGVLRRSRLERIDYAVISLVHDLAEHDDRRPADRASARRAARMSDRPAGKRDLDLPVASRPDLPNSWRGETPVLCVAGRGLLDGPASGMLAQLLAKHGLGAREIANEASSQANIDTLDTSGIAMICVISLEVGRSPSHLRHLLRRLRQRLPGIPILLGLWPQGGASERDEQIRGAIAADHHASSLREAVAACLRAANVGESNQAITVSAQQSIEDASRDDREGEMRPLIERNSR